MTDECPSGAHLLHVVGYLGSRIAPGSLKHVGLLTNYLERFPSSLMWFALFASLNYKRQLHLSNLGRLVWRALSDEQMLLSRPRCDIALDELRILTDAGALDENLRTVTPGRLVVEIAPCVNTVVRWPLHATRDSQRQGELFSAHSTELKEIVAEIGNLHQGLDRASKKLGNWVRKKN